MFFDPAHSLLYGLGEQSCLVTALADQSVAGGVWVLKTLDDIVMDEGDNFNTTLSKYTIPEDGQYLVTAIVTMKAPVNGHYPSVRMYKNGVYLTWDFNVDSYAKHVAKQTVLFSRLLTFSKDDYLQLYVSNNGAQSKDWSYGLLNLYMLVIRQP